MSENQLSGPLDGDHPLQGWLRGSVFFLLSAALILMGLAKVLVPIFDVDGQVLQKLLCVGAINVYELMLLGVLLFLLWRCVFDDAVSVVLLLAVFMVASAVTLDVVAASMPHVVLMLGALGLLVFGGKLYVMCTRVLGPVHRVLLIAMVLLMVGNFIIPGMMGYKQHDGGTNQQMHALWFAGWHWTVLSLLVFGLAMLLDRGQIAEREPGDVMLHRRSFGWTFAALLTLATLGHQWALQWAFFLKGGLPDLLMALPIVAWVILEWRGVPREKPDGWDAVAVLAPVCLIGSVVLMDCRTVVVHSAWSLIADPYAVMGMCMLLMLMACRRCPRWFMVGVVMLHLLCIGLLWPGSNGYAHITLYRMIWAWAGLCIVLAVVSRHYLTVMLAIGSLGFAALTHHDVQQWCDSHNLTTFWLVLAVSSIAWGIALCLYRKVIPWWVGMLFLLVGNIAFIGMGFEDESRVFAAWLAVFAGIVWTTGTALGCGRRWLAPVGLLPLIVQCYQLTHDSPGWQMITASFVLLGVGAAVSWYRSLPRYS